MTIPALGPRPARTRGPLWFPGRTRVYGPGAYAIGEAGSGNPSRRDGVGEVGTDKRSGLPHLTPTLSAPDGGGEGDYAAGLAEAEYEALLRADFAAFAQRAFHTLYPQSQFQMHWHVHVITARLAAVRAGHLPRLLLNLPPRHLKSLLASVAFPAWSLGHETGAEIVCVSYAQELADKWSCDSCRIVASP